jgi:hypothetical protein
VGVCDDGDKAVHDMHVTLHDIRVDDMYITLYDMCVNTKCIIRTVTGWVVEFDGSSHFLTCRLPVVGTLMKQRHLGIHRRQPALLGMGSTDGE